MARFLTLIAVLLALPAAFFAAVYFGLPALLAWYFHGVTTQPVLSHEIILWTALAAALAGLAFDLEIALEG